MTDFQLTPKQLEAQRVIVGPATHVMLFGGSRSGKTFLHVRNIVMRALKAPKSRHAIFRFRRDHVKTAVFMDTFPKVMATAFPGVRYETNKSDLYAMLPGDSEIWFGGLDDKERADKILGQEHVTILLNECTQIPLDSAEKASSRLAQRVEASVVNRAPTLLKPRMFYDCNPTSKAHWSYRKFILKQDPTTKRQLLDPDDYAWFQMNPRDNVQNLGDGYLKTLEGMSARQRKRFLDGEFADATPNALFSDEHIESWRVLDGSVPDMVRIVVSVDPSGSGDVDNADNDEIGIMVIGLGTDGNAYVLEDCTVKAGPATWGKVAVDAYDRHEADVIVGESNFGGAMVEHTIKTAAIGRAKPPYKAVHASRGKAVRAEPIAALYEQGKVRHVGRFGKLEDELAAFSTVGYLGDGSPNRADSLVWGLTELFPSVVSGGRDLYPKLNPMPGLSRVVV